jgi:hypothetical protein
MRPQRQRPGPWEAGQLDILMPAICSLTYGFREDICVPLRGHVYSLALLLHVRGLGHGF